MKTENCGNSSHDAHCLCDVKIETPTPINFNLSEIWQGQKIIDMLELAVPWSGKDLAEYGEAILTFHDLWIIQTEGIQDGWANAESGRVLRGPAERTVVKAEAMALLREPGGTMFDLPTQLEMPFNQVISALTGGSRGSCWDWDSEQWIDVEAAIHDDFPWHGAPWLAKKLGCPVNTINSLSEWYGAPFNKGKKAQQQVLKNGLLEGLTSHEVVEKYLPHFDVTLGQVRAMRAQLVNELLLPRTYGAKVHSC